MQKAFGSSVWLRTAAVLVPRRYGQGETPNSTPWQELLISTPHKGNDLQLVKRVRLLGDKREGGFGYTRLIYTWAWRRNEPLLPDNGVHDSLR